MKHKERFKRGRNFIAKARSCEPTDPKVRAAIEKGMNAVRQLDPIVREAVRDDPAALAEWDDIMHSCDDLDEDVPN